MKKISKIQADLSILLASFFWGSTFIITKNILNETHFMLYIFIRFSLASIFLIIILNKNILYLNKIVLFDGVILGMVLFLVYSFQTFGLKSTNASNAAFITGLYIIIVPLIGALVLKHKIRFQTILGIIITSIGLFFFKWWFKWF